MEIKYLKKSDDNLNIFATERFLKSLKAEEYGWIAGYEENKLLFILPFIKNKKRLFKYIQFRSQVITFNENSEKKEQEFLNKVIQFIKKEDKVDFIICPPTNGLFRVIPSYKGVEFCGFGSYVINLKKTEEELWNAIHGKHRNVIRKAINNNIEVKFDENNLEKVYEILEITMQRSNLTMGSKDIFIERLKNLEKKMKVIGVYKDKEIQGVGVFVYNKDRVYYLYGGHVENSYLGAMNYLHWEAIKYFKNLGIEKYDFLGARLNPEKGSKLEGIQRFKSRFGGELEKGYLWKIEFNKKKAFLFEISKKIYWWLKRKKYIGDIIEQEKKNLL